MRPVVAVLLCTVSVAAHAEPIAHYALDKGAEGVVHDGSGNGHDGRLVGATWSKGGLRFDGSGDYVDLGDNRALKIAGDLSIFAWATLTASPYPDGTTNWTIVDCERFPEEGFILRVDGGASKLMYRADNHGKNWYRFGNTALENQRAYLLGVVVHDGKATLYVDGRPDGTFDVGQPAFGSEPMKISSPAQSFTGVIHDVRIYGRALSLNEVVKLFRDAGESFGKTEAATGCLGLESFVYDDERRAIARVDFFSALPLGDEEAVHVEVLDRAGAAVRTRRVEDVPASVTDDYAFELGDLPAGDYTIRAVVRGPSGDRAAVAESFTWPTPPPTVPSPQALVVGPLPAAPARIVPKVLPATGGALRIVAGGCELDVESAFSIPDGWNRLATGAIAGDWSLEQTHGDGDGVVTVSAKGQSYLLKRIAVPEQGRVLIHDTVTNLTEEPIAVLFRHSARSNPGSLGKVHLAGMQVGRAGGSVELKTCPIATFECNGVALGLVPLDDVFIVQSTGAYDGEKVTIGSDTFALGGGKSHTFEWAVYALDGGGYYDLVNAVRHDDDRNHVTVQSGFAFVPGTLHRRSLELVPDERFFKIRNADYISLSCLSFCSDDPSFSLEGIEFMEYPLERQRVRQMMDAMNKVRPGIRGMFHVAHQLYANATPDRVFADSRVLQADGTHAVYPYDYSNGNYFTRQRYEQNWRWWIYYPTFKNSFGKAMLDSIDVMMDEMGAEGVFVDGYLWGYGGDYTYDRWDGVSADVDPQTHRVKRLKGSVILLTQEFMAEYTRRIVDRGGVVIGNNTIPTRTICRAPVIVDKEITEGPYVHLATTPIALGNPAAIRTEQDVYEDVRAKLAWGNLYFYYGEPANLTYESVPAKMYPITFQEIHSGTVKGKERIVTMHPGIYGWRDGIQLHRCYRYDSRGHQAPHAFVTTVDADGVRTLLDFSGKEMAVIERIPVTIETAEPVNVLVERCGGADTVLRLNGIGKVILHVNDFQRTIALDGPQVVTIPGCQP